MCLGSMVLIVKANGDDFSRHWERQIHGDIQFLELMVVAD
jgi:hypothetical protein